MKKPAVFGFYGYSNTGKTTLIIELIKKFKNDGFKIATIKITDKKVSIDKKGKDTWKFSKAGSNLVILSSTIQTGFIINLKMNTKQMIKYIENLNEYDIIFIEGSNNLDIPKIRLNNKIKKRSNTIITFNNNINEIIEFIKNEITKNE